MRNEGFNAEAFICAHFPKQTEDSWWKLGVNSCMQIITKRFNYNNWSILLCLLMCGDVHLVMGKWVNDGGYHCCQNILFISSVPGHSDLIFMVSIWSPLNHSLLSVHQTCSTDFYMAFIQRDSQVHIDFDPSSCSLDIVTVINLSWIFHKGFMLVCPLVLFST